MLLETKLPEIQYKEDEKVYHFPEVDLRIVDTQRLEFYAKAPYLHPQAFQSDDEWLLLDVDPILHELKGKDVHVMIPLILDYLSNCQDETPCHKSYI